MIEEIAEIEELLIEYKNTQTVRYKKIMSCLILVLFCMGLFSGCKGYFCGFNSSEEAQKYVLTRLKDKYDEKFTITGVKEYKEEKIGLNWINVKVASETDSSKTATVYARNTGYFKDDYHVYYYADQIEKLAASLCENKAYILKHDIEINGHMTTTEWSGEEGVDKYIEEKEYEIETDIYLYGGKTDDEYADEISDIMQEIMESDLNFNITVYGNNEELIFYSLPDQHDRYDKEYILEEIADVKSQQETIKNYEEWKKQNRL